MDAKNRHGQWYIDTAETLGENRQKFDECSAQTADGPPRKRSFDRKQFVPYLEKFSSDREIEKLFLEFLQERAKV